MSNSKVRTESQTESFIRITRVDCSNFINCDRVQMLSYRKYSSLVLLPDVGIEPRNLQMILLRSIFQQNTLSTYIPVIINRIGTIYPCISNKGFSLRFRVDSRLWHETPEEPRKTYRPKRCEYYNKDEVNSPNILSNNFLKSAISKIKQIIVSVSNNP